MLLRKMAPGIGGNGGNNRPTGTVPKSKARNESSRDYNGTSRREFQHFNHMPNNLSSLDWQPVNDPIPHSRTRKESNTSASRYSEFDTGEENTVSQDNLWFNSSQHSQVYQSDDDEVSQASWAEGAYKSNNLGVPDKAQVATRLTEIRDYVSQTESLMEGLRTAGGQCNLAQHEKLAAMLEGLRNSELKLQTIYKRLERLPPHSPVEGEPDSFIAHQVVEPSRERANRPVASSTKSSESAKKNELKKQVQLSHLKLQELQEQQVALRALRQKAHDQLNKARETQIALLTAQQSINVEPSSQDNMIQDRLQNLQRYFDTRDPVVAQRVVNQEGSSQDNMIQDRLQNLQNYIDTRNQLVQLLGLEEEVGPCEIQIKVDELHTKKQHLDQVMAQFTNTNRTNTLANNLSANGLEESESFVDDKIEELNNMSSTLARLQASLAAQLRAHSQERPVNKEPAVEMSNSVPNQSLQAKSQQLNEARTKLQQLQSLLQTVEELREAGQPIPDSVLQLMGGSEQGSSPSHPDRSDMSPQDLNVSQPVSEQLLNNSERERIDLFPERHCRAPNSCERERVNHQQSANPPKHNNQQGKLSTKMQLEDLMRHQELNFPQPLQSSSFHENLPNGAWGGSIQGPVEENYNAEFLGDLNESASVKNATSQPTNAWRKPSSGSGHSRFSWTSPYVPQDVRQTHTPRQTPPSQSQAPSARGSIPQQPDNHWIVHQISQLQSQLQQMTGFYKNIVEKQHNCTSPWMPPNNISAALGPYCQYIASTSQWQQQQLLVHSLNQCCQLIWHQQRELAALKDALQQLQHPPPEEAHFTPPEPPTPPSNLSRTPRPNTHVQLKPSLSVPAVVSSAHSLPNLSSPQTTPASPQHLNNRNILSSPTATVLSLPPTLNNAQPQHNPNLYFSSSQFTDPNFINLYPPYGNNLNFEFPSPVNFFPNPPEPFLAWATTSQPQTVTTLNNQVPPGNRANNYWDNFRSYSRQNLLSSSGKSNDGLPQRSPMERFLNTDSLTHPREQLLRNRKERLNEQSRQTENVSLPGGSEVLTRAQVHVEALESGESGVGEVASGYQNYGAATLQAYCPHTYQHNLCLGQFPAADIKPNGHQTFSTHSFHHNVCNDTDSRVGRQHMDNDSSSTRLVNDCETPRGRNKKGLPIDAAGGSERKVPIHKQNYIEATAREAKISQLNNYQTESSAETNTESEGSMRAPNQYTPRPLRNINSVADNTSMQHNCIGDGYCLMASEKGVRRKDNKGNFTRESKTEVNKELDSLEECVYSEVAALISSNDWRPEFLLQLFKDLRLLSSCADPNMQAALSSIHTLATRTVQVHNGREATNEEVPGTSQRGLSPPPSDAQPRNWSHKEPPKPPQLPTNCAKLDWEVRSILVEMLPHIHSQMGKICGIPLLEAIRQLVLNLVPSQSTQEQLDAQLEDALHKFHGCRLGDVYEELLTVVADVLISELTFLRLVNTVHHSNEQPNGEEGVEQEDEGAVGGVIDEPLPNSLMILNPANQSRRTKSETVSEADLAEADQSRHTTVVAGEDERGETAEGIELLDEAAGRDVSAPACNGDVSTEAKTEINWAVEQDREMGLDQVPTRLNPNNPETEQEAHLHSLPSNCSNPGPSDPGSM